MAGGSTGPQALMSPASQSDHGSGPRMQAPWPQGAFSPSSLPSLLAPCLISASICHSTHQERNCARPYGVQSTQPESQSAACHLRLSSVIFAKPTCFSLLLSVAPLTRYSATQLLTQYCIGRRLFPIYGRLSSHRGMSYGTESLKFLTFVFSSTDVR